MKDMGVVLDIDTKYSPKVSVYRIDTGTTATYKMQKALYQRNPFDVGQVLHFYAEDRPRSKLVDGKWEKDPTVMEPWITNYVLKYL